MIQDFVPTGRKNAISRHFLSVISGKDDRNVRKEIAEARLQGIPIIYTPNGGYYMPDLNNEEDRQEFVIFIKKERSRAREIIKSVVKLEEVLARVV